MFTQAMKTLALIALSVAIAGGGVCLAAAGALAADTAKRDKPPAPPGGDDVKPSDRVEPYHVLKIQVPMAIPDLPIDGYFPVRLDGTVDLGFDYGKVKVVGLTIEKAQAAVTKHLVQKLTEPQASVAAAGRVSGWRDTPGGKKPYRVQVGQVLTILVAETLPGEPIDGPYTVGRDGEIDFGATYGKVAVKGLTLDETTKAILKGLRITLKAPRVSVLPGRWEKDGPKRKKE